MLDCRKFKELDMIPIENIACELCEEHLIHKKRHKKISAKKIIVTSMILMLYYLFSEEPQLCNIILLILCFFHFWGVMKIKLKTFAFSSPNISQMIAIAYT